MRHLVVCCDGTWNTADQMKDGVPTPTNVVRIHHAAQEHDGQLRYYHPGVGTDPGIVDRLRGGGLGAGLAANIKSAYSWLATNYRHGDAICLFGFSRGAYTVRSLVGMLTACGLAEIPADVTPVERWGQIERLYDEVYRPERSRTAGGAAPHPVAPVRFLGVWDTVGSLGVPDSLGVLKVFDVGARHRFHDTRLSSIVEHARHALAMDETRGPFTPTLWTDLPAGETGRSARQVWFPGDHSDVGGGHRETGLSDGALRWMIDEAVGCTGLDFHGEMIGQIRPDPGDVLHDSCTGLYRNLDPAPRAVPRLDVEHSVEVVHRSAFARQQNPPITIGTYRTSTVPTTGQALRRTVYANQPWNATGLYLEPGTYEIEATGEWLDRGMSVGPGGTRDGRFHLPEVVQMVGSLVGRLQDEFRELTGNDAAELFGAPRAVHVPWMALVGVVAAQEVDEYGAPRRYRPFLIGAGCRRQVDQAGYLYAFANDAWGFYDNNRGSVTMTVTLVR